MKIEIIHSPFEAGEKMEKQFDAATIQHQYDALIKSSLKHEAKSYLRELKKQAEQDEKLHEVFGNDSTIQTDRYKCECFCFQIDQYKIYIEDEQLSEAIYQLTAKQRIALLLFYFENMSDDDIGKRFHVDRSTIFRHRKEALRKIKEYMERTHYADF